MVRKIELMRMMFHSLMTNMSEDEKLDFLTEVFLLSEEFRYNIAGDDDDGGRVQEARDSEEVANIPEGEEDPGRCD
jgi:hypothetical protein